MSGIFVSRVMVVLKGTGEDVDCCPLRVGRIQYFGVL